MKKRWFILLLVAIYYGMVNHRLLYTMRGAIIYITDPSTYPSTDISTDTSTDTSTNSTDASTSSQDAASTSSQDDVIVSTPVNSGIDIVFSFDTT